MAEEELNWETNEVIDTLINDEGCYNELLGEDAETIRDFVEGERAPVWLYQSFQNEHASFRSVDWEKVACHLSEDE